MQRIGQTNLWVGGLMDYLQMKKDWAVIHATQTVHYKLFGWHKGNRPDKEHPHYLMYEKGARMSLNWVDGRAELFEWYGPEGMSRILDFIKGQGDKQVLIHCDCGCSRAPSIALLYCAKRLKIIPNLSFDAAAANFLKLYPKYSPNGIAGYLKDNWNLIL